MLLSLARQVAVPSSVTLASVPRSNWISGIAAVSWSIRSSMTFSRTACSAVKNSAPASASSSLPILRRALPQASRASTPGVALAGDQVVKDVPAGHPVQAGDHAGQLQRR